MKKIKEKGLGFSKTLSSSPIALYLSSLLSPRISLPFSLMSSRGNGKVDLPFQCYSPWLQQPGATNGRVTMLQWCNYLF